MSQRFRCPSVAAMPLLLALLPAVGCSGKPEAATAAAKPASDAPEAKAEVVIDNFTFNPPELTVAAGTKVTWTNRDDVPHTVTSTTRPRALESPTLDTDQTFTHVFSTPGTFEYFCAVHPKMTGRVLVK